MAGCGDARYVSPLYALVGHQREAEPLFLEWVRQQPEWRCVVHGGQQAQRCHLRSRGAAGSDRWVLPLCHDAHRASHDQPAWWYRHRVAVAEWFAFLPKLWERFERERREAEDG